MIPRCFNGGLNPRASVPCSDKGHRFMILSGTHRVNARLLLVPDDLPAEHLAEG